MSMTFELAPSRVAMNTRPQTKRTSATAQEPERIRRIYSSYNQKGWGKSKWSRENPGNRALVAERQGKARLFLSKVGLLPLGDRKILEVGCGTGGVLLDFIREGAAPGNCHGVDIIPERIAAAKKSCPGVEFAVANATKLPYGDRIFDLVLTFTLFSSIESDEIARSVACEINRVLKPGGAILCYDMRYSSPTNDNVRKLTKTSIRAMFPNYQPLFTTLTLLPPLARRLGGLTRFAYPLLATLPYLRTHLLCVLTRSVSPVPAEMLAASCHEVC
jgi:SAM-dependent methyltransferase